MEDSEFSETVTIRTLSWLKPLGREPLDAPHHGAVHEAGRGRHRRAMRRESMLSKSGRVAAVKKTGGCDPIFCARDHSGSGDIPRARRYLARAALSVARETLQARATGGGCDPLPRRIPLIPLNPGESRFGISRIHVPPASRGTRKVRRLAHRRFQSGVDRSIIPGAAPRCAPGRMR